MKQIVEISGRRYDVELPPRPGGQEAVINDQQIKFELVTRASGSPSLLILNGKVFDIEASVIDGGFHIYVDGMEFDALVTDERREHLQKLTNAVGRKTEHAGDLKAPMPGLVVKVSVQQGQLVEKGEGVMVIEAMKMENEIRSPVQGVVGSLHVTAGQIVEKGAHLMTIKTG